MGVTKVEVWFREALKPDPILTVSSWADKYRILSRKSASEAGQWRTERTPYLKEIMDTLTSSHPAKKIVFKKSSQTGGTEAGNNWIGYIIDCSPGPVMMVLPRVEDARRNSKLRIDPLIEENPRLLKKVGRSKSRDSSNTILQKAFEGGELVITGSNSVAGLKSMPARFLFLDEVDEYPQDIDGQGDPISLVMARSRTFSRRKAFIVSSPTVEGESKIDLEFKNSDQRFFHVPCPHCDHFQRLSFKNLKWEEGKPETAQYYCENCGEGIQESTKTKMLKRGKWVARNPGHEVVGFHINSLYSPVGWFSWKDIASDYEDAKRELEEEKKTEKMRTFVNTVLGKTYKEEGEKPEWERIYYRREPYHIGTVPEGGVFLTCGVDVQKDRLECEVVAWGRNKVSWSIDYKVFAGETEKPEVWAQLETFVSTSFPSADNKKSFPIKMIGIDSGFNTQHVYNFCRKFPSTRVIPLKGSDAMAQIIGIPRIVDVRAKGKTYRRGVKVWTVGVSHLKSELYGFLKLEKPIENDIYPTGFCHFPEYDSEYFKQITAETIVTKRNRKGFSTTEWVKSRERNEALDCRIYNRALASLIGIDRFKDSDWDKIERNIGVAKPLKTDNNEGNTKKTARKRPQQRAKRSNYW